MRADTDTSRSCPPFKPLPHTTRAMVLSPRQKVDHTYHDFSHFIEEGGVLPKQKKAGSNFPANLQRILSDANYSHIITWMPHGRAWKILDKELLVSSVIPTYFGQSRFESFTRQLSSWGFKRLHQSGPDYGCYYHQCFLRGLPSLTALMERLSIKSKQGKLIPHAEGEPRFYLISQSYPLPHPSNANPSANDSASQAPMASNSGAGMATVTSPRTSSIHLHEERHRDKPKQSHLLHRASRGAFSLAVKVTPTTSPHGSQQNLACQSLHNLSGCTSTSTSTLQYTSLPSSVACEKCFSMQAQPITATMYHPQDSIPKDTSEEQLSMHDFVIDAQNDFRQESTQGDDHSDSSDETDNSSFDAKDFLCFLSQLISFS